MPRASDRDPRPDRETPESAVVPSPSPVTPRALALRVPPAYDRAGRALLAIPFLDAGAGRLLAPQPFIEAFSGAGLPFAAGLNYASAVVELAGGALLVVGVQVWAAALALFLYTLPVTFVLQGLPAQESGTHASALARSLAIAGGLLLAAAIHRRAHVARRCRSRTER